jgi:protein-disulfide isomerase
MIRKPSELTRRLALASAMALAAGLTACGGGSENGGGEVRGAIGGDNVLGDPNAPVTVIEYASVTCPHCKAFHDQIFPEFKERFIDTGQVRFVFRELPTPPTALAYAGFLMARCAPEDKYFDVLDLLFERQVPLIRAYQAGGGAARDELLRIARPMGLTDEQFDACVRDQDGIERIEQVAEAGFNEYGVSSTPQFVIDGKIYPAMPVDEFAAIIEPLLAGG